MEKYTLLLVCSDAGSKQRLKECIRVSTHRIEAHHLQREGDYASILNDHVRTDFILIGSPSHQSRITLAKNIKDSLKEQCPPILALVGEADAGGSRLAALIGAGCDGIVLEPLSVNTLDTAITHILASGKFKQFREQRDRGVAQVVCASACVLLDKAAELAMRKARLETDDLQEWRRLVVRVKDDWNALGAENMCRFSLRCAKVALRLKIATMVYGQDSVVKPYIPHVS